MVETAITLAIVLFAAKVLFFAVAGISYYVKKALGVNTKYLYRSYEHGYTLVDNFAENSSDRVLQIVITSNTTDNEIIMATDYDVMEAVRLAQQGKRSFVRCFKG